MREPYGGPMEGGLRILEPGEPFGVLVCGPPLHGALLLRWLLTAPEREPVRPAAEDP